MVNFFNVAAPVPSALIANFRKILIVIVICLILLAAATFATFTASSTGFELGRLLLKALVDPYLNLCRSVVDGHSETFNALSSTLFWDARLSYLRCPSSL